LPHSLDHLRPFDPTETSGPNEAFSFQIATDDQDETDRYWNAIVGKAIAAGAKTSGAFPGKSRRAC
jgi:predicted 3-demethylubiquinone-9 3-methyltransferase (glyoxalase superfamily)